MAEPFEFSDPSRDLTSQLEQGICQDLAGITLFCEVIVRKLRMQKNPLEEEAVRVRDLLEQAKQDLRRVAARLQNENRRAGGSVPTNAASRGEA